jgi:hypothetical protein
MQILCGSCGGFFRERGVGNVGKKAGSGNLAVSHTLSLALSLGVYVCV